MDYVRLIIIIALAVFTGESCFAAQPIGTEWGFFGDSQTAGRAPAESSCSSSPECIANILSEGTSYINGLSGRSLAGSHSAYDAYASKAGRTWVHFQESGNQDSDGQRTAAEFGTTFEAAMTNIHSDSPSAVITYETAFSFGREAESYRNWTAYNAQLLSSVSTLSGSGVTVIVADVDTNIKLLQEAYTPSDVWYQSGDANEYHYTAIGNLMVALTVIRSLGYDLDSLSYTGVSDIDSDVLATAISIAQPSVTISGITGTIGDGQTITIRGTDFGSSGPNVVLFDDFESGSPGDTISIGPGSAKYGQWTALDSGGSTKYSVEDQVSGSQSFIADYSVSYQNWIETQFPQGTTEVFFSWWLFLPSGQNYPGENAAGVNWKQMWIMGDDTTDDDFYAPARLPSNWIVSGNDKVNQSGGGYTKYVGVDFVKGSWHRMWWHMKGASGTDGGDGKMELWQLNPDGVEKILDDQAASNLKTGGEWERLHVMGWGNTATNCTPSMDDIYVASGPNAQARVEIGNASSYMNSTKLSILTPTSWSDSSISAMVNIGSFSPGDTAYMFVFKADGSVSPGFPITIGGGEDTNAPTAAITQSDPQAITANSLTITGTCTGDGDEAGAKWRIGSAPDATHGTACTGTTNFSCDTSGYSVGANTVYVGCYDEVPNYGSDSITVNYTQDSLIGSQSGSFTIH